jgi:hypothetical protein
MILSESAIQNALDTVKARFPEVTDGRCHNAIDDDFLGFTLWGTFALDPDELTARRFFITFTQEPDGGQGDLTVGQPAYFWTRADAGDAYWLDTPPCATLEEAIAALKKAMRPLAQVVAGELTGLRE